MHVLGKTITTVAAWGALWLSVGALPLAADETDRAASPSAWKVTVDLESGRRLTAEVDGRTDERQLWLRWSRGSAHLLRPVQWDRIRLVELGDESMSGEELRRRVAASRPPVVPASLAQASGRIVLKGQASSPPSETERPAPDQPRDEVAALAIDAAVANWDSDLEPDGLIVDVYPLDRQGRPVAVDGTLEVELVVATTSKAGLVESFSTRGRWTERVRPADFQSAGARYELPFSAIGFRPERDLKAAPYGLLHATLSVPGQGVFSASESSVRVRPYSAVRDAVQATTGRRFLPQEQTGLGGR